MKTISLKKILFLIAWGIVFSNTCFSQVPEDALRNSWFIPQGTARYTAIGGAMGSLGGDITANYTNPAGIGLFKTREVVATPGLSFNSNSVDYRGTASSLSKTNFSLGPIGFIAGGMPNRQNSGTHSFSIAFNQLANFNNHIYYKGTNNASSFSEQYLEELTLNGADTISALNDYIFGSSLAFRTYLIDKVTDAFGNLTGYQTLVPVSSGVLQENDENSKGGLYELSFAFANNDHDKLYLGASINVPISSYTRDRFYKESDLSGDSSNDFSFFHFTENFQSSSIGINAKLGLIYKPQESIRLGFALHTPSLMFFNDEISASLTTNTEGYAGEVSESSNNLNGGVPGSRKYLLLTPLKLIGSASYVFSEVEDTRLQNGFITADVEYVNYHGARFYSNDETSYDATTGYYDALNVATKDYLKSNINFKIGGELKFDPWAVRIGGGYYGSPYEDKALKANKTVLSAGLGYRNHGMYIDAAYAYFINKDVNFPYRLSNKPNTFAEWKNNKGTVVITAGFKF